MFSVILNIQWLLGISRPTKIFLKGKEKKKKKEKKKRKKSFKNHVLKILVKSGCTKYLDRASAKQIEPSSSFHLNTLDNECSRSEEKNVIFQLEFSFRQKMRKRMIPKLFNWEIIPVFPETKPSAVMSPCLLPRQDKESKDQEPKSPVFTSETNPGRAWDPS